MSFEMITSSLWKLAVAGYQTGLPRPAASDKQLQLGMQIAIGILAAISVLMIVIAGFRYIAGQGSPEEVAKARSTITYAIIGLLVAISAQVIVTFVLDKL